MTTSRGIPVAVSGRHVHLSAEAVETLFGPGYQLTEAHPLRQPGNWAAAERVKIKGPKGHFDHVAILGPLRNRTQIEISRTDAVALGIDPPVRDSGALDGTPKVQIIGPAGTIETDGLIIAARHIHINPKDAAELGLHDRQFVDVQIKGTPRELTFGRTLIRVQPGAFTEMHIDTDEGNAAGIGAGVEGSLVPGAEATVWDVG